MAPTTMAKRVLSYLIFAVVMTVIIAGSAVVVVALYLPFVALKAIYLGLVGKVSLRRVPESVGHTP